MCVSSAAKSALGSYMLQNGNGAYNASSWKSNPDDGCLILGMPLQGVLNVVAARFRNSGIFLAGFGFQPCWPKNTCTVGSRLWPCSLAVLISLKFYLNLYLILCRKYL